MIKLKSFAPIGVSYIDLGISAAFDSKGFSALSKKIKVGDKLRIGIDPDLSKSGVAVIKHNRFNKQEVVALSTAPFFTVLNAMKSFSEIYGAEIVLEAGWLNKKSNYHVANKKGVAYSAVISGRIGKNVGENHAVGKLMEEWCVINKIAHKLYVPKRGSKKWDAKLFKQITKFDARTSSETRDATRAAWI